MIEINRSAKRSKLASRAIAAIKSILYSLGRQLTLMRVLLIEDDVQRGASMAEGLKQAGHVLDDAAHGKDGLFLALEYHYDVMVGDLEMDLLSEDARLHSQPAAVQNRA